MKEKTSFKWNDDSTVYLDAYLGDKAKKKQALIILPGGGYNTCAPFEAEPVALKFESHNFACFVLYYSVRYLDIKDLGTDKKANVHTIFPEPLLELASAIKYVKENADEFNINKEHVSIMGFSAGGHLAANYSNLYADKEIFSKISSNTDLLKPFSVILGYAASELTEDEMILPTIFGERNSYPFSLRKKYSAKENVNEHTCPTFLFHSATDGMVPAKESIELALELAKHNIPYELHVFGTGGHAYGVKDYQPYSKWVILAIAFINGLINNKEKYEKIEFLNNVIEEKTL